MILQDNETEMLEALHQGVDEVAPLIFFTSGI
jgi:hypothetical protein